MKRCLFVGRYQPLHKGHITLIKTRLDQGDPVWVGVRDTEVAESDPYSYEEREKMFYKEFKEEIDSGMMVVTKVPDIKEICYGRKVGYKVTQISLDKETEAISATNIRNQ